MGRVSIRLDLHPQYMTYELSKLWELERRIDTLEEDVVAPLLYDAAQEIADTYKRYTRRVSGELHRLVSVAENPLRVVSEAEHAIFVEKGTRPHLIEPATAQALRFVVDGAPVFARHVHHPGTAAQHPMRLAYHDVMPYALHQLDLAVDAYVREVMR